MKVRPRGWGALMAVSVCVDAMQFLFDLVGDAFAFTGIGLVATTLFNLFSSMLSVGMRVYIWFWGGHYEQSPNFAHVLLPTIAEFIPFVNILPSWTLFALTYWVEEEHDESVPPTRKEIIAAQQFE